MNSDDLIEQILSKGVDYDKSQITVESVLKDLINTNSNVNLTNPIPSNDKEEKKDKKKATTNYDLDEILKEGPKEIEKIQNKEKVNDIQKEEKKEIQKEETKKNSEKDNKDPLKEIEKEMELAKKEKEKELEKELEKKVEEEKKRREQEKIKKEEEEKLKKKKEEERKKLDSFIPQFPNPVDFVQYIEILRVNTKISGEMQNFLLQNHRKKDNKYNISIKNNLQEITKKMSGEDINLMFTKKDVLALCTTKGNIYIFLIRNQKLINQITPKNIQCNQINCLDISDDLLDMICGYQDGTIAYINIKSGETKYINNKIHVNIPCIEIKIYKKEKENEIYFISSGGNGQVFYIFLKKMLFWIINTSLIINRNIPIFMIKSASISRKNQYYFENLNFLKKYLIFGSLGLILIATIEPIELVLEIKKPEHIIESVVPDIQIGIGRTPEVFMRFAKKDEKNHLLLIVSWGNIIYLYQLSFMDGKLMKEIKEIGYYINILDILRIGFLNSSVIYCLDKSHGIKLLDTSKMNSGKIKFSEGKAIIPKSNNLAEIEKSRHISEYITSQLKIVDSKEQKKETYLYSIIDNDLSLQILGGKEIYSFNLVNWDIFLNEKQKNNDFLNMFSVGMEIYNGKLSAFSNLPDNRIIKRKVGDFLKEKIPQYINATLKDKKSNIKDPIEEENIYECINIVIEVCIELEAVEFLIRKIEPLFEEKEYGSLFLARLEPFILCDKIIKCVLSSDIIFNLIDLYYKNNKLEILSQMLLHINIIALDKPEIKKKFEEINLIIPLIYLCHNGKNEDYFYPLQKMFDNYITQTSWNKSLINEEDNMINYTNAIIKKILTIKEVQKTKEYHGHRILWYIKWCLTGKKFPDNLLKMKDNLFDDLVPKIAYWLLKEKVISEFLSFDPKNYFIIYKNILSIESLYSKLSASFKDVKLKKSLLEEFSSGEIKIEDITSLSLIDYLVNWSKKKNENKIYFYLYDFIIAISKNNDINIKKELIIESAIYILKYYKQIIKKINNQEIESFTQLLIEVLKSNIFNIEDYKKILSSILDNIFDEIKFFLLEKTENYKSCLNLYLDKDSNIKKKGLEIYKWLNEIINKANKESIQYKELLEGIKDNIFPLISISLIDFYYLSRQIFQNLRKEIIDRLKEKKNIQLEYIELFIHSLNKKEYDIDDDPEEIKNILILHINLLCELKQFDKIVPSFLLCPYYPFEECLYACEKAKAIEACIYLYVKEGSTEKAFDFSISKLDSIFNKHVENIDNENKEEENQKLLKEFKNCLLNTINICENNDRKIDDLWFKLLDILNKYEDETLNLIKKNENNNQKKKTLKELHQVLIGDIKDLTEKMCSYVSIRRIIEVVTEKNKDSGIREYKDLIMRLLGIYSNSTDILFSVKRLLTSLIFQNENLFREYNSKGGILNKQCDKCHKEITSNKINIFNCKHTFHKECIKIQNTQFGKEAICPICPYIEFDNNSDKNSLIKNNRNIIKDTNNQEEILASKIIQKFQNYDNKNLKKNKLMIDKSLTCI